MFDSQAISFSEFGHFAPRDDSDSSVDSSVPVVRLWVLSTRHWTQESRRSIPRFDLPPKGGTTNCSEHRRHPELRPKLNRAARKSSGRSPLTGVRQLSSGRRKELNGSRGAAPNIRASRACCDGRLYRQRNRIGDQDQGPGSAIVQFGWLLLAGAVWRGSRFLSLLLTGRLGLSRNV